MIMINILLLWNLIRKLLREKITARLKQANLPSKRGFANFVKTTDFDNKLKNNNKKVTNNKYQQKDY